MVLGMEQATTEQKIISAAIREFAHNGFAGARIDRIAKQARINKAMIYYHFRGKEALYERVLFDKFKGIMDSIEESYIGGDDPLAELYASIRNYVKYITSLDADVIRIILREISGGGKYFKKIALPTLIVPIHARVIAIIEDCQRRGLIREVNPHYLFFQTVGAINFFNIMRLALGDSGLVDFLKNEETVEEYTQTIIDTLRMGVQAKEV